MFESRNRFAIPSSLPCYGVAAMATASTGSVPVVDVKAEVSAPVELLKVNAFRSGPPLESTSNKYVFEDSSASPAGVIPVAVERLVVVSE